MACPSCLGLMFVGSLFCGHCGTKAVVAETEDKQAGNCPRCRRSLERIAIGDSSLAECSRCGGMWADVDTFEQICADRERQSAVLTFGSRQEASAAPLTRISYVPCPDCGELMNRSNFAKASGVIIDICKKHGVWFDSEELPRIVDFIRGGGMQRARQRELDALEQERIRLREERRQTGGTGSSSFDEAVFTSNGDGLVKGFIRALFDQ
jgi:Zn-finger nucleic acid-binding protein